MLPVLAVLVFSLKLALRVSSFGLFLHHPHPVLTKLFKRLVLLPTVTFTLTITFHLRPLFFVKLVLVTYSPNNDSSGVFSGLTGNSITLSMSLATYDDVLALVAVPVVVKLAAHCIDFSDSIMIGLPINGLVVRGLILVLIPVVLKLALHSFHPTLTTQLSGILSHVTFPTLVLLTAVFFIRGHTAVNRRVKRLNNAITTLVLVNVTNNIVVS